MDQFEAARKKYEKNRERQKPKPVIEETPEKSVEVRKHEPMSVVVYGPCDLVFEVDYAGTLLSSQMTPQALTAMFKKQLAVFGRVKTP